MFEIAGTNNIYDNSVYVGGSDVVSASATFGFVSNVTTGTRNYVDNIFWNARSNASGAGKNYAIALSGVTGATSNYNDLYASGTGGFVGLFNSVDQLTLADWRTATGQDLNSISANPVFVNPTGNGATFNLHLDCGSPAIDRGIPLAAVTNDFDGDARSATMPDIGADETNFMAPAAVTAVSRKLHGATAYDLDLLAAGNIESRSGGANGNHQIVVTFASPVTIGGASITSGVGVVTNISGTGTNTIVIDLANVTDAQILSVKLTCLDDGTNRGDLVVAMGVLFGDVNHTGFVDAGDALLTRSQSGETLTQANFGSDVNTDGFINIGDTIIVRGRSGNMLPMEPALAPMLILPDPASNTMAQSVSERPYAVPAELDRSTTEEAKN
jgi:hypothetical protein